jgi:hypothetical protein
LNYINQALDAIHNHVKRICMDRKERREWIGSGHHMAQSIQSEVSEGLEDIAPKLRFLTLPAQQRLREIIESTPSPSEGDALKKEAHQLLTYDDWNSVYNAVYRGAVEVCERSNVERRLPVNWEVLAVAIRASIFDHLSSRFKKVHLLTYPQINTVRYQVVAWDLSREHRLRKISAILDSSLLTDAIANWQTPNSGTATS